MVEPPDLPWVSATRRQALESRVPSDSGSATSNSVANVGAKSRIETERDSRAGRRSRAGRDEESFRSMLAGAAVVVRARNEADLRRHRANGRLRPASDQRAADRRGVIPFDEQIRKQIQDARRSNGRES